MKWNNKEHELDAIGEYLRGIETIYLWGAGGVGKRYFNRFPWLGIENDFEIIFVDSNPAKQGIEYYGKLYGCNYHAFAVEAGIAKEDESDYIYVDKASKKEIFEFLLGYSDKCFVDYCKHCSGFLTINKNKIRPAEQAQL